MGKYGRAAWTFVQIRSEPLSGSRHVFETGL